MAETELVLGVGCQRGTPEELLARGIDDALASCGLATARVRTIATSERKRDEAGLLALARQRGWSLRFHDDLEDGVAEPAARKHGRLLVAKRIYKQGAHSMTVAIAEVER